MFKVLVVVKVESLVSKVKINSKQIFESHVESFSEEHECEIIYLEDFLLKEEY